MVKEKPGIVPNPGENIAEELENEGYKLPKILSSNLAAKKLKTFGDIVLYYKSLFHIKEMTILETRFCMYITMAIKQVNKNLSHGMRKFNLLITLTIA